MCYTYISDNVIYIYIYISYNNARVVPSCFSVLFYIYIYIYMQVQIVSYTISFFCPLLYMYKYTTCFAFLFSFLFFFFEKELLYTYVLICNGRNTQNGGGFGPPLLFSTVDSRCVVYVCVYISIYTSVFYTLQ